MRIKIQKLSGFKFLRLLGKVDPVIVLFFLILFVFTCFLMWKTFYLDAEGNWMIAAKAWSDYGATLPLIRSFSHGFNFPPEYPLFSGYPIRYHFGFFLVVGLLEKLGVPIDWALNLISIAGFFLLLYVIYLIGKHIFKSKSVGIVSIILFLFNGSWAFLEFFKKHPISFKTPLDIIKNTDFSSFGPYDGKIVSAFWNLNIYTNQRHLALAYAAFLLMTYLLIRFNQKPKKMDIYKTVLIAIGVGLFPFIHLAVFGMMEIALVVYFLFLSKIRLKIIFIGLYSAIMAIPQILYMGPSQVEADLYRPGYLVQTLNLQNFSYYWLLNLGLAALLMPIGFVLVKNNLAKRDSSTHKVKQFLSRVFIPQRVFLIPFLLFFVIGNLFQFSPDLSTNHKFFNLFAIGINFFAAYTLVWLWRKNIAFRLMLPLFLFFMTLSGIIDLFPIVNDQYMSVENPDENPEVLFIEVNSSQSAVFLNSHFLYHPANLAGRRIYMGWPYFSWSAGYDTHSRDKVMKQLFMPQSKIQACQMLLDEDIDFVEIINPTKDPAYEFDYLFFEDNFQSVYQNKDKGLVFYSVAASCK